MGVSVDTFGQIYITDTGDMRLRRGTLQPGLRRPPAAGTNVAQILQVHFAPGDGPALTNPYNVTGSADFTVSTSTCTVNIDTTQDCLLTVNFKPSIGGSDTARLAVASITNGTSVFNLSGTGTAASIALDPGTTALVASGLNAAQGIALDPAGNTLVADTANNRILRYPAGSSTPTIIGATAGLKAPRAVGSAPDGTLYIADTGNNIIRRVDSNTGVITTVAGGATSVCSTATDAFGDGCLGTAGILNAPAGLTVDSDGNVFISDTGNNILRELSASGYLSYVAGGAATVCAATGTNGADTLGNGCPAAQSIFTGPTALALDSARNLYIADTGDNEVREVVSASSLVVRIAGNRQAGSSGNGGTANVALLTGPTGVAVDAAANVYIADTGNNAIRVVSAGIINTLAGSAFTAGTGTLPGSASLVQLTTPSALATTPAGRLTILDSGNARAFTIDRGSVAYNFGRTKLTASSPVLQIQETSTGNTTATSPSPLFTVTGSGSTQFTLTPTGSNGCSAPLSLAPGSSCLLAAQFTPTVLGAANAVYTESATNTINNPVPFVSLSGTGAVLTATTTTVAISGTPQYAVPFTVTATIVPTACNPDPAATCIPTGTVTFFADGLQQGLLVNLPANGVASTTISGLTVGRHTITAIYSGDNFYASSTSASVIAVIAQGPTTTTVTASSQSTAQFSPVTLTATVAGPTTNVPTGSISFYAGTVLLGTASVNNLTGKASLSDATSSFNLPAGTYALTAVYSGDANYAPSTSAAYSLTIAADAATFSAQLVNGANVQQTTVGTAQGSTGQAYLNITPSNTFNGVVTFACVGMPSFSDCTFSPTSLTFAPVPGVAVTQQTQVTLFTDINPAVINASISRPAGTTAFATLLGWPVLLSSIVLVFGFRRRLRGARLLSLVALFGILAGGATVLTGCGSTVAAPGTYLTPPGVYTVQVIAKSGATTISTPVTFTVTAGVPGQL